MSNDEFKVGSLVWAKMKGYPAWPAQIVEHPNGSTKANQRYVFFFGSLDYGWVKEEKICPYYENIGLMITKSKRRDYQEALSSIAVAYRESRSRKRKSKVGLKKIDSSQVDTSNRVPDDNQKANRADSSNSYEEEQSDSCSSTSLDGCVFEMSDGTLSNFLPHDDDGAGPSVAFIYPGEKWFNKHKRTKSEQEERQKLIDFRLRVQFRPARKFPMKKKTPKKDKVITVKEEDYKKVITKELVIVLKRCDE